MKKQNSKKADERKLYAFLATFLSVIGFIIALILKKDDEYVMHYAKQSLIVFIVAAILGVGAQILLIIPILGNIIYFAVSIITLILWIFSWMYSLSGEKKEVPVVGQYARKIDL